MTHKIVELRDLPNVISSRRRYIFIFEDRTQLCGMVLCIFETGQALILFDSAPNWNPNARFALVDSAGNVIVTIHQEIPTFTLEKDTHSDEQTDKPK